MIYLIGGGARCGKSTLAKTLLRNLPNATYLSGDSLRQSLKPALPTFHTSSVNADNPEQYIRYYKEHTDEAIDDTLRRAEVLWPFIERYIVAYQQESEYDLIVESVDIWPQFIQKLAIPHKAIFLVDTGETQWKRVTEYLGENDWITTKKLSLEQVKAWAFYNAPRGNRIIEAAKQYGYEAVDIAERGFEGAQSEALRKLGQ